MVRAGRQGAVQGAADGGVAVVRALARSSMTFMVVDFPAPLAPRKQGHPPGRDGEGAVVHHYVLAVVLGDVGRR